MRANMIEKFGVRSGCTESLFREHFASRDGAFGMRQGGSFGGEANHSPSSNSSFTCLARLVVGSKLISSRGRRGRHRRHSVSRRTCCRSGMKECEKRDCSSKCKRFSSDCIRMRFWLSVGVLLVWFSARVLVPFLLGFFVGFFGGEKYFF